MLRTCEKKDVRAQWAVQPDKEGVKCMLLLPKGHLKLFFFFLVKDLFEVEVVRETLCRAGWRGDSDRKILLH